MKDINMILAENIFNHRKRNGLSQSELARLIGVTAQAVSKWEKRKAAPDISTMLLLVDVFGCSLDELFSREGMIEKSCGN